MHRVVHSESIRSALAARGWTQDRLAREMGESAQLISLWLSGQNFPRPAKLLKLASTLQLGFDQLVLPATNQPIVAFRRKAGAKTTDEHISKAMAMGALLKPLVQYLPQQRALHTTFAAPSTEYAALQTAAAQVRQRLNIGAQAVLKYEHLIKEFKQNDAVLVPVLWGARQNHKNALHILLPSEKVTFVYLNLDTHLKDFKFWMAHELAHVYAPQLAGSDEGEDFSDAFAGALLFPQDCAEAAYASAVAAPARILDVLLSAAQEHVISLNTVFVQVQALAANKHLPPLPAAEKQIHAARNSVRGGLVSESLFKAMPPEAEKLIAVAHDVFRSDFFIALKQMLTERGTGIAYLQQILDVGLRDATALHKALVGEPLH